LELEIPKNLLEKVQICVAEIFDVALFGEAAISSLVGVWRHLLLPVDPKYDVDYVLFRSTQDFTNNVLIGE
jgi:hypothetical protein